MKTLKTLAVIFLLLSAITDLYAQSGKVVIILKQPPPNMLGVGDMWNLTLENTTKNELKIYLTGTATEEKDGLIIEGKSKVFTLKPGKSSFKYNDFSGAEIKYNNGKYKESLIRQGYAPEGSYTICVTAFDESGNEVGRENCIMQNVIIGITTEIFLLHPCDLMRIDCNEPLIFTWTPMPKPEKYTFRLYETGKEDEDDDDEYIFRKKAIIEENDISGASFKLPTSIKLEEGKRYAWSISVGDIRSRLCWFYWCPNKKLENPNSQDLSSPNGISLNITKLSLINNRKLKASIELINNSIQSRYVLYGIAVGQPGIMVSSQEGPMGISPDGELECSHEETVYYETFMIWFGENCVNLCEIAPSGNGFNLNTDSITVTPVTDFKPNVGVNNKTRADLSFRFVASNDLKRISGILKDKPSSTPPFKTGETWNFDLEVLLKVDSSNVKYDLLKARQFTIEFTIADDTGRESEIVKTICFCSMHKGFHDCNGICVWPFEDYK